MFMSQFEHSIDAKGRAIVPAKYREGLGELFYVTKGADGCLSLYPQEEWDELAEKLRNLPSNKNTRIIQRQFMGQAAELSLDKQGRILIPANLRKSANLERDIIFVGMMNRVEIWDKDTFEKQTAGDDLSIEEALEDLGISL